MNGAIHNVAEVGENIQTTKQKDHANFVWRAVVNVDETPQSVMLKDEPLQRFVKELLAVELAQHFDVSHITGWAVSLDRPQALKVSLESNITDPNDPERQLAFASKLSYGVPIAKSGELVNQNSQKKYWASAEALSILVFDELVGNYDRQYENVMQENGKFLAFDHDKIFFNDHASWSQLPTAADQPCPCSVSDDIGCWQSDTKLVAKSLAESWASRLPLPSTIFNYIVSHGLLSGSDAQYIQDYLRNRLQILPDLVTLHY